MRSVKVDDDMCKYLLLVNPVVLGALPADNLTLLEPKSDLLLGVLDGIGTVAHVTSNIDALCEETGQPIA